MESLPKEIIEHIVNFISQDITTLSNLSQVCKSFQQICDRDETWKPLFFDRFPLTKNKITKQYKRCFAQLKHYLSTKTLTYRNTIILEVAGLYHQKCTFSLVGPPYVGKSTTSIFYAFNKLVDEYDPTMYNW